MTINVLALSLVSNPGHSNHHHRSPALDNSDMKVFQADLNKLQAELGALETRLISEVKIVNTIRRQLQQLVIRVNNDRTKQEALRG